MWRILVNDGNLSLVSNGKQKGILNEYSNWSRRQEISKRFYSIKRVNNEKNLQHRC